MGFVAYFVRFPAVQKFWKSVKTKGGTFLWDTVYNYIHNANAETKANAKVMTKYLHFCILKKTCHLRLPTLSINIKHCFSTAQISTLQAHPGTLEPYTATQELSSVYPNLQDIGWLYLLAETKV